jgi:hypothetical protein
MKIITSEVVLMLDITNKEERLVVYGTSPKDV